MGDAEAVTAFFSSGTVGRGHETGTIEAAIEAARDGRDGRGSALALVGEAGVGKSRLRVHAERYARSRGLLVLSGRAVEGTALTPYRPLAEALSSGFREEGTPRDPAVTALLPTLAHLVPHWSDRAAPHTSVVAIAEALLRLVEVTARDRGVLLAIEDLHWADQDTIGVLEYFVDNTAAHQALSLLTLRPDPSGALRTVRALADRRSAAVLPVPPLPAADMERLVLSCLGQDAASEDLLGFVTEEADGIPFFAEELLAGLARAGVLRRQNGDGNGDGDGDGEWRTGGRLVPTVPVTFADSVARRVGVLAPEVRRVLCAAALLGRDVDWRLLAEVTGCAEDAVFEALREAGEAQLLVSEAGTVRFRHALTREAVRDLMLPPERLALARRALDVVDPGQGGDGESVSNDDRSGESVSADAPELVADLALLAGDQARAAEHLITAAERARDRGALATAGARLEHAASVAATGSEAALVVRERLAEVRALSGDVEAAVALAEPALAARQNRRADARYVIDLELVLARAALTAGSYDGARAHADRALASAAGSGDRARSIRAEVLCAQIEATRGRLDEAERLASGALAHPRDTADQPEVRCEALEVVGRCLRVHDVAAAGTSFEAALELAERHGLSLWRARALHELGTIDLLDTMTTERLVAARRAAVEAGSPALAAVADFHLASALVARNELGDGRAAADRAVALAERLGLSVLPAALTVLARSHAHERDIAATEAVVARARAAAPGDGGVEAGIQSHVYSMLALHEADRDAARAALDRSAELLRAAPGHHDPHRGLWALLCTLEGDGAAEREEVARAAGSGTRFNRTLLRAAGAVALGRAGDREGATEEFARAMVDLRVYQGGEWMVQAARWLVAPAAHADGWGDPVGWLQTAVRWFADHAYEPLASSCRRMLRGFGERVPRAGRGSSPVPDELRSRGVTSREVDVLRLVVAGRTNREIARSLVLSPKTVEKHVASLLLKTGLPDRVRLRARFADSGRPGGVPTSPAAPPPG